MRSGSQSVDSRQRETESEVTSSRRRGRPGSITFTEINLAGEPSRTKLSSPYGQRKPATSSALSSAAKSAFTSPGKSREGEVQLWREVRNNSDSDISDLMKGDPSMNSLLGVRNPRESERDDRSVRSEKTDRIGRRRSLERDVNIASTLDRQRRRKVRQTYKNEEEKKLLTLRRMKMRISNSTGDDYQKLAASLRREKPKKEEARESIDDFLADDDDDEDEFPVPLSAVRAPMNSFETFRPPSGAMRESESPFRAPGAAQDPTMRIHQLTLDRDGNIQVHDYGEDLDFVIPPRMQQRRGGSTLMRTMKRMVKKKKT